MWEGEGVRGKEKSGTKSSDIHVQDIFMRDTEDLIQVNFRYLITLLKLPVKVVEERYVTHGTERVLYV